MKESEDIGRAKETLAAIEEQQQQLEADLKTETAALDAANDAATEKLERVVIKPKKTNVTVKIVALVWTV
jgi:DNA-binding ferritin-like protein